MKSTAFERGKDILLRKHELLKSGKWSSEEFDRLGLEYEGVQLILTEEESAELFLLSLNLTKEAIQWRRKRQDEENLAEAQKATEDP